MVRPSVSLSARAVKSGDGPLLGGRGAALVWRDKIGRNNNHIVNRWTLKCVRSSG